MQYTSRPAYHIVAPRYQSSHLNRQSHLRDNPPLKANPRALREYAKQTREPVPDCIDARTIQVSSVVPLMVSRRRGGGCGSVSTMLVMVSRTRLISSVSTAWNAAGLLLIFCVLALYTLKPISLPSFSSNACDSSSGESPCTPDAPSTPTR